MKLLYYTAALCLVAVHAAAAPAPPPKTTTYRTKILGVWEVVRSGREKEKGITAEFTPDGKVRVRVAANAAGLSYNSDDRYTVDGDKITIITRAPGGKGEQKEIGRITKLTDTELHLKDARGETAEFKRKR